MANKPGFQANDLNMKAPEIHANDSDKVRKIKEFLKKIIELDPAEKVKVVQYLDKHLNAYYAGNKKPQKNIAPPPPAAGNSTSFKK